MRRARISVQTYERIAPFYDLVDLPFEYLRYRALRPLLFEGLSGRILDAGVGTGRNISFYPADAEVVAVDRSPAMLKRAARRRRKSLASLNLVQMDLAQMSFPSASLDAAVASFVFCTMPAQARTAALLEIRRVLKPSGRLRLLEYAPARTALRRGIARVWQPWARWAFGAELSREIEPELAAAGLELTRSSYVSTSIRLVEATPGEVII